MAWVISVNAERDKEKGHILALPKAGKSSNQAPNLIGRKRALHPSKKMTSNLLILLSCPNEKIKSSRLFFLNKDERGRNKNEGYKDDNQH